MRFAIYKIRRLSIYIHIYMYVMISISTHKYILSHITRLCSWAFPTHTDSLSLSLSLSLILHFLSFFFYYLYFSLKKKLSLFVVIAFLLLFLFFFPCTYFFPSFSSSSSLKLSRASFHRCLLTFIRAAATSLIYISIFQHHSYSPSLPFKWPLLCSLEWLLLFSSPNRTISTTMFWSCLWSSFIQPVSFLPLNSLMREEQYNERTREDYITRIMKVLYLQRTAEHESKSTECISVNVRKGWSGPDR